MGFPSFLWAPIATEISHPVFYRPVLIKCDVPPGVPIEHPYLWEQVLQVFPWESQLKFVTYRTNLFLVPSHSLILETFIICILYAGNTMANTTQVNVSLPSCGPHIIEETEV